MINDEECKLFQKREITSSSEFDRASLELLRRVHSAEYLTYVNKLSKQMEQRQTRDLLTEVIIMHPLFILPP